MFGEFIRQLVIASIITFIISGLEYVRYESVPKTGQSFISASIVGIAAGFFRFTSQNASTAPDLEQILYIYGFLIAIAAAVGIAYFIVGIIQQKSHQNHLNTLLNNIGLTDTNFLEGCKKMAYDLIEPDFMPDSRANTITGIRRKKREIVASHINAFFRRNGSLTSLGERDLLPNNCNKSYTNLATDLLFVISFGLWVASFMEFEILATIYDSPWPYITLILGIIVAIIKFRRHHR